ncbi:hypothetical protein LK994_13720 [Ferruginibacter lapsinanis]|uniref:hypothetical protein n=1 Tax=Ferruginibacter lapsinanis TaxID=563172 RepID=UPI001E5526F5|nr:hypothetical protein [Ferruginibacter lapsinanis]UEG49695.1 hypothetical protein LK994_13720 [Ferruginibacter lapsinanis]
MRYTILIAIFTLLFIGCKKDKFTTAPQLKYKSVNTKVLDKGQILKFTLGFTDSEGDVDSIFLREVNPKCSLNFFKDSFALPAFPPTKNVNGDIFVTYGYRVDGIPPIQEPLCANNDTCYFQFVIKDSKQNKSDTVSSETIVIIK